MLQHCSPHPGPSDFSFSPTSFISLPALLFHFLPNTFAAVPHNATSASQGRIFGLALALCGLSSDHSPYSNFSSNHAAHLPAPHSLSQPHRGFTPNPTIFLSPPALLPQLQLLSFLLAVAKSCFCFSVQLEAVDKVTNQLLQSFQCL